MADISSQHATYDFEEAEAVQIKSPRPDAFCELALDFLVEYSARTEHHCRCDSER